MHDKRKVKSRRKWVVVAAVAALVIASVVACVLLSRDSVATLSPAGGEAWNGDRTVGISAQAGVAGDTTNITFKRPQKTPAEAPIMAAMEVIVPAVDIVPSKPLATASFAEQAQLADGERPGTKVQVKFKVPSYVPLTKESNNGRQRSIYNADIQVFNEALQAWLPLGAMVDGDTLVADAPHFSMYRVVWAKVGEVTIRATKSVKLVLDEATAKPVELVARTAAEFLKSFYTNSAGKFDDGKMADCQKSPAKDYKAIATTAMHGRADACVYMNGGKPFLLMRNGWSFPMMYVSDAPQGVWAETYPTELDLAGVIRNQLVDMFGKNVALASGLDVGKFRLTEGAPDEFTVTGSMSVTGLAVDMALATFAVFMPQGYALASQVGAVLDTVSCYYAAAQKLLNASLGDLPARFAEIAKSCFFGKLIDKIGGPELLKSIAKEVRLLPELIDATVVSAYNGITGQSLAKVTIRVAKPDSRLDWLKGKWAYKDHPGGPAGIDSSTLDIGDDLKGTFIDREYVTQNDIATYTTKFHVGMEGDKPVFYVDATNHPVMAAGDKLEILRRSDHITLGLDGNFMFWR